VNVETLQPTQKSEAVGVLARSFRDYPLMRFVFQDAGPAYDKHARRLIDYMCESRFRRHWPLFGLRDQGRLVAVAVVSQPGDPPADPELDRQYTQLQQTVGEAALGRFAIYDAVSDRGLPRCPHHYLGMIGVRPEYHRRGYGRRLVQEIQQRAKADPSSEGLCLNTETESNLPFYRSLGFRLIAEADFAHLHTWCFFWP
jgi:ribosomal protein S18 acetylase RimI-like enzyme